MKASLNVDSEIRKVGGTGTLFELELLKLIKRHPPWEGDAVRSRRVSAFATPMPRSCSKQAST